MLHLHKTQLSISFFLLCLLLNPFPASAALAMPAPAPAHVSYSSAPCMFTLPGGAVEGVDVQCGYLTVPQEHANPTGPTIRLAVAVIKANNPEVKPDPLFMLQGGPGGSTIDTYTEPLLTNSRLRANRDIVLFDQRGTLYSEPKLTCKEIDQLTLDNLNKDLSDEEALKLELQALSDCRQRLLAEGVDLSAFDSLENAADIEDLRLALGYEKINLYGVSYGTLLALHYMRAYPSSLRSVILDGVVPPQTNFILNTAKTIDRSFKLLFSACAGYTHCNRAYPNLENVFYELVDKLEVEPAKVKMTDPETGITYDALIDGETFQSGLFQLLYVSSLIPALPRMIYDAQEGNFDFFSRILSILVFDRTMSYGMYYSIVCAEDADFDPADQDLSGINPHIVQFEQGDPADFLAACRLWDVVPLDQSIDQPVSSTIPTLLLSGGFDPITPPSYAQQVAGSLSLNYNFIFPAGGHGQALEGECQDHIILSFLEDPNSSPNASCIVEISQPDFYTPANLIDIPVIIKLANLDSTALIEFALLFLALLVLLSAFFIFPLTWLVRRFQHKPLPSPLTDSPETLATRRPLDHPFPLRVSSWLAALNGLLLFVFLVGLIVVAWNMISANDNRLFFGVSGEAWPLFILPILVFLFTLGMLHACLQIWLHRSGTIWSRLYYSFLAFSALLGIIILAKWGALTVFL